MSDTIALKEIAHARSGDKGNHANVGVIAWTPAGYEYLDAMLTAERVAEFFRPLVPREVERYALPGIRAYNFVLRDVLAGGASRSLRIDSQGKTLGVALLELRLPKPPDFDAMRSTVETH
ncbi:MAG: AtuA-related protein [Planctomycetaceae bacterium]